MSRYSPWAHVAELDVLVVHRRLPSGYGWWVPGERVIVLDDRLTPTQRRCTLAHEVQHAEAGDSGCGFGMEWFDRRQELRAERAAARELITLEHLHDAMLWGGSDAELADELWVDLHTLQTRLDQLHPSERGYLRRRIERRDGVA